MEDRGTYTDLLACLVYISIEAETLVGAEGGCESRSVGGRDEGEDGEDSEEQPVQQRWGHGVVVGGRGNIRRHSKRRESASEVISCAVSTALANLFLEAN